ncbi:MAG: hypothetical protein ABIR06_04680 [Cyclobacteriaceae bacterium]
MVEKKQNSESWAQNLNLLVIKYFKDNLPLFVLIDETSYGPYWGVKFSNDDLQINIGGDIGFSVTITISGKDYPLLKYDKSVNNAMETTEENILLQLKVAKQFLSEPNGS